MSKFMRRVNYTNFSWGCLVWENIKRCLGMWHGIGLGLGNFFPKILHFQEAKNYKNHSNLLPLELNIPLMLSLGKKTKISFLAIDYRHWLNIKIARFLGNQFTFQRHLNIVTGKAITGNSILAIKIHSVYQMPP